MDHPWTHEIVRPTLATPDTAGFYRGFYGTEQLLATARHVECIFYQNDAMAFGGLQYCDQKGMDIPNDIGIAGWGDLPISSVLKNRLTSVHVSHLKVGQKAAEAMIARLSGEPIEKIHDIGSYLISGSTVRQST